MIKSFAITLSVLLLTGCNANSNEPTTPTSPKAATTNQASPLSSIYIQMRGLALSVDPQAVGVDPELKDQTIALIVDWKPNELGQLTIACFADGGASIYFSSGGGVIGGIEHEDVRVAVKQAINLTQDLHSNFVSCDEVPTTDLNHMRFTRITPDSKSTVSESVDELLNAQHPLHHLASSIQSIIALLRSKQQEPQSP